MSPNGHITMLSIGNYGRFANMLFQVAGVIGIGRKNNLNPVFRKLQNLDHKERFGSTDDIEVWKYFKHSLPALPERKQYKDYPVQWGYHNISLGAGDWNVSGHFQSRKYFNHCLDEVRYYMEMINEPPKNDLCAIHIRLSDYDGGYHPRLGMEYYEPAMREFGSKQKFLVFSDDIASCRAMFGGRVQYSEGNDYIFDFRLMKSCSSFIIGNSSYSAMAAILADAERVIAPNPWFGPKYTNITGADIYCPEWKIIDYQKKEALCA